MVEANHVIYLVAWYRSFFAYMRQSTMHNNQLRSESTIMFGFME